MFKKTVSIVIVSVLAISIGAVSVFASSSSGQSSSNGVTIYYSWDASSPVVVGGYRFDGGNTYIYASGQTHPQLDIPTTVKNYITFKTSYTVQVIMSNNSNTPKNVPQVELVLTHGNDSLPSNVSRFSIAMQDFNYQSEDAAFVYANYGSSKVNILIQGLNISPLRFAPYMRNTVTITFDIYETLYSSASAPDLSILDASHTITNVNLNYGTVSDITMDEISYNDTVNLQRQYEQQKALNNKVQSILDAYTSNSQNAQDLKNETQTNDQKLNNIHQSEAQWYSQNSQAIESTGLSNFEFSTDQSSALTGVFSLFQRLWTALGDYTFVVTFTLMMSFATFFLRHNPVKKTSGNNYSRNYSKGGGESHGSSAG